MLLLTLGSTKLALSAQLGFRGLFIIIPPFTTNWSQESLTGTFSNTFSFTNYI